MIPDLSDRHFDRILIIKPSSLGDVIHALPVLHGLRMRYADAKIDWLINKGFAPLMEAHPALSEVVEFDRNRFGGMLRNIFAAWSFRGFLRSLRMRRYDAVIDLQGLFRSGFLAHATKAPVRVGFANAREGAFYFYTHRIPTERPDDHAVNRNYLVSKVFGFENVPITFNLSLAKEVYGKAKTLLSDGQSDQRPLVVIAPGARWETKIWPAKRYAALIDQLVEKINARCVLVGSPDEQATCEKVQSHCFKEVLNLQGRTDLPVFGAVLSRADLIVCHDSAAAHFAAALDRPLVCITGPTNPKRTGPYNRIMDVIRRDLPCSPCYLRKLSRCRHEHRCMRELSVDEVLRAAMVALGASSAV